MITLPQHSVELLCTQGPSSILEKETDTDTEALQESLTHEDLKKIWNNTDTSYSDDEKLILYWHQRLRHVPQNYIRKLA